MTSERQVQANRRNALKSTGPRTRRGKRRSSQNALQHGLTAETVVTNFESIQDYRAFEDALLTEHAPQTTVGRRLVVRLASLLWRLRRASLIETGLFEIQAKNLDDRRREDTADLVEGQLTPFYRILQNRRSFVPASPTVLNPPASLPYESASSFSNAHETQTDTATVYLRLCNLSGDVLDRLGRYETGLSRQLAQTLFLLNSLPKS